jgi:spore coat polysaccharide biosynthesis protein SpsF
MERYLLKIGVIVQARMGSSRLPEKVLKKLGSKNLLEHILFRCARLKHDVEVVIATSELQRDDAIESFCKENDIKCFRGSEQNVLERFYQCAKENSYEHIVRLTGDNPFVDAQELDRLIELHLDTKADYSRSFLSLPKGVGAEIFSYAALEKSYENGVKANHKEHVNEYIEENEDMFKISELQVDAQKNRPDISLTVDTLEDYKKASFIIESSSDEYVTTLEAIELCSQYV